jgi:hypothetical protein
VALRAKVKTEMKGKTSRWVTREEAKVGSKKARRRNNKVEVKEGLADRIGSSGHK